MVVKASAIKCAAGGYVVTEQILVVEPEETIRQIVVSLLSTAGYKCAGAKSGNDAVSMLASGQVFDLVLSSLMMVNLDGMGLLGRIKDKYPDVPLIMMSEVTDVSVVLRAIRSGAYDFLVKPFERELLLRTVSRALEDRRLKLENRAYVKRLESLVKSLDEN